MAVQRKVVTISVPRMSETNDPLFNYEEEVENALEAALPVASGWHVIFPMHVKGHGGGKRDVFVIWAER